MDARGGSSVQQWQHSAAEEARVVAEVRAAAQARVDAAEEQERNVLVMLEAARSLPALPQVPAQAGAPPEPSAAEVARRNEVKELKERIRQMTNDRVRASARHGKEINDLQNSLTWQRKETIKQQAAKEAAEATAGSPNAALEEKIRKDCEDAAFAAAQQQCDINGSSRPLPNRILSPRGPSGRGRRSQTRR